MAHKLIAFTGPSLFTPQCIHLIEEGLSANGVYLVHNKLEHTEYWLSKVDAVVLSGGIDIHPVIYEENIRAEKNLTQFDYNRDIKELLIIDYCFKYKIPILGICRGHQILSVYKGLGKDFIMDLSGDVVHQPSKYNIKLQNSDVTHHIHFLHPDVFSIENPKERSFLHGIFHTDPEFVKGGWVNSWHHQGIKYIRNDKKYIKNKIMVLASAKTGMEDKSEVIEVMMGTEDENFWISAQFHPESDFETNSISKRVIEMFDEIIVKNKKEQ